MIDHDILWLWSVSQGKHWSPITDGHWSYQNTMEGGEPHTKAGRVQHFVKSVINIIPSDSNNISLPTNSVICDKEGKS